MTRYLYLMRAENDTYRIGITNDIKRRFFDIYHNSPIEVELFHLLDMGWGANELEKELHDRYERVRIKGDWFALTSEMIEEIQARPESVETPEVWPQSKISRGNYGQVFLDYQCPKCKRLTRAKNIEGNLYSFNCKVCDFTGKVEAVGTSFALRVEEY